MYSKFIHYILLHAIPRPLCLGVEGPSGNTRAGKGTEKILLARLSGAFDNSVKLTCLVSCVKTCFYLQAVFSWLRSDIYNLVPNVGADVVVICLCTLLTNVRSLNT